MTTLPPLPTEADLAEADRIDEWWDEHWEEFMELYPEQYVAVRGGEVVATKTDLVELIDELTKVGLRPPDDVWVRFVGTTPEFMVL